MKRDLAAIAVADDGKQMTTVAAADELRFGDARKFLTDRVPVARDWRSERVEPHLLIKMAIGRRAMKAAAAKPFVPGARKMSA